MSCSRPAARLLLAAVPLVALAAGAAGGDAPTAGENTGYVEGDGSSAAVSPGDREPAPEVAGETLEGEALSLADYAGDVVVINFWASWCAPCRAEKPVLADVHTEYGEDGLRVLGVNIKDNLTAAQQFAENFDLAYESLYDQPGEIPQAFRDTVPPQAIPSTLVIDREGRIAGRIIGQSDYTTLSELVDPVVAEDGPGTP